MEELESKDSTLQWLIVSAGGSTLSKDLPRRIKTFEDFILVDQWTGDSDPVYWAVATGRHVWGYEWASRFCVAMLAYYHTGTALEAADRMGNDFWDYLEDRYESAPRGSERRHFRGVKGKASLKIMRVFQPNASHWFECFKPNYINVRRTCERQLYGFGSYFQLKICDYMDRCLTIPIKDWAGLEFNLPTEPEKSLKEMNPKGGFNALVKRAQDAEVLASPMFDRLVGPAEVETALCGYHTCKHKGNWMGADILDKRDAVYSNASPKALAFRDMFPKVPDRQLFTLELE